MRDGSILVVLHREGRHSLFLKSHCMEIRFIYDD